MSTSVAVDWISFHARAEIGARWRCRSSSGHGPMRGLAAAVLLLALLLFLAHDVRPRRLPMPRRAVAGGRGLLVRLAVARELLLELRGEDRVALREPGDQQRRRAPSLRRGCARGSCELVVGRGVDALVVPVDRLELFDRGHPGTMALDVSAFSLLASSCSPSCATLPPWLVGRWVGKPSAPAREGVRAPFDIRARRGMSNRRASVRSSYRRASVFARRASSLSGPRRSPAAR